ncbi:hypothetical protein KEM54_000574 [Ascosphaera aggregata]|nr:hypothetical protein KEM54_000574 [Ascosphaera aggregata]
MTSGQAQECSSDIESAYGSTGDSVSLTLRIQFTASHLRHINRQLQSLEPQGVERDSKAKTEVDILRWCITTLPGLYQTTALGLTGLVTIDMLSKLDPHSPLDLIFFDTLYHFKETLDLMEKVKVRYPNVNLHVFKPRGAETVEVFVEKYGDRLWERDEELYDWVAKVEPAQRAYEELNVQAILTGRRRSQGAKRGDLNILEVDDAGLIKVNPLANWSFSQVRNYISENNVPYNELLDRGYKSVGDWHSTQPVKEGEDERAGRWKGQAKTECGIHNPRSRYAQFLKMQEWKNAAPIGA